MQTVIRSGQRAYPTQPMGVRVVLLTDVQDGRTAHRLARCGGIVDVEATLDAALSRVLDDPMGYDLFVMDCDAYGGLAGAELAVSSLIAADAKMRVMLVSRDFDEQAAPVGRRPAVSRRAACREGESRRGFDYVVRDKTPMAIM